LIELNEPSSGLMFAVAPHEPPAARRDQQALAILSAPDVSAIDLAGQAAGHVESVVAGLAGVTQPKAVAVTLEPEGGMPAPTGAKYLVGAIGGQSRRRHVRRDGPCWGG
jgi:hypothetical protein